MIRTIILVYLLGVIASMAYILKRIQNTKKGIRLYDVIIISGISIFSWVTLWLAWSAINEKKQ